MSRHNNKDWDINDAHFPKVGRSFSPLFEDTFPPFAAHATVGGLRRVAGRPLQAGLRRDVRGGAQAHIRLGHAQHQQPQRGHLEKVLLGRAGLLSPMHRAAGTAFGQQSVEVNHER